MSPLWVPPAVSRELEEQRLLQYAKVAVLTDFRESMRAFNRELKELDPYLQLVKAKEDVEPGTALRAGYWHILRHNPDAPPSIMRIQGPGGEYVEPRDNITAIWKMLTEWMDLQNPAVEFRRKQREAAAEDAARRMEEREREEIEMEAIDRAKAAFCTSVSMTNARPWTQNTTPTGVRGRGRGRAKKA
jgi:hypothetical protein